MNARFPNVTVSKSLTQLYINPFIYLVTSKASNGVHIEFFLTFSLLSYIRYIYEKYFSFVSERIFYVKLFFKLAIYTKMSQKNKL